jgi:hypothetical protein
MAPKPKPEKKQHRPAPEITPDSVPDRPEILPDDMRRRDEPETPDSLPHVDQEDQEDQEDRVDQENDAALAPGSSALLDEINGRGQLRISYT